MLPGIDTLLVALSQVAQHLPRDSHYTYWLWNDGREPLTFTGDPQEVFFNRAVNNTDRLHTASCDAIRPICEGSMNVTSSNALAAIEHATRNTMELVKHYRSFMSKDETLGRRSMEPWFFMTRMRTYLPTYPIQGTIWEGVNAANVASQMQLDYLIGNINQGYAKTVQMRSRFLTEEDRNALDGDMKLPSVFDVLGRTMRLTRADVESLDEEALSKHVNQQSSELHKVLAGYKGLFNAAAQLTAIHWALIQNYLVKPAASLTEEEKSKMAVPPDHGTGGKTHAQTEAIMKMRREDPAITKLLDCVPL